MNQTNTVKPAFCRLSVYTENLSVALCNDFITEEDLLLDKSRHYQFLVDYFSVKRMGHDVKTIVVEETYLSKSYLQDYSNFYSNCYVDYKRFCKRVHFFTRKIKDEKDFLDMLLNPRPEHEKIWDSYVGYVVIRPLSKAIFGATLLKTFQTKGIDRHYTAVRPYTINLFGKKLKLDTLVCQEQDSVVGACALSALWSALHKLSMVDIFHTQLFSPSDITKAVKSQMNEHTGRIFPNRALTLQQVFESVQTIGLVSESFTDDEVKKLHMFKAITYGYLKMGLPVLLMMKFGLGEENEGAHHLITINGFRLNESPLSIGQVAMLSDRIEKFYAHDDQVGPFSQVRVQS